MSHIAEFAFSIPRERLLALKNAVEKFCPTLEFAVDEHKYRTWKNDHGGTLVGDWNPPAWLPYESIGENAAHVIRHKNPNKRRSHGQYEIGIVPVQVERDAETGKELSCKYDPNGNEFKLVCDFYAAGNGILREPGVGRTKSAAGRGKQSVDAFDQLKMFYQISLDELVAEEQGDQVGELMDQTTAAEAGIEIEPGCYARVIETEARVGY